MKKKKDAVKAAATAIDGREQMQLDLGASTPLKVHYTPQAGTIASVLMIGQNNAMTAHELSTITGLPLRIVTKRIQAERLQGAPIMSAPESGYWLASDATEVIRCAEALHRRAKTQHATAAALKRIVG